MDDAIKRAMLSFSKEEKNTRFNNKKRADVARGSRGKKHWKSIKKQLRGWATK